MSGKVLDLELTVPLSPSGEPRDTIGSIIGAMHLGYGYRTKCRSVHKIQDRVCGNEEWRRDSHVFSWKSNEFAPRFGIFCRLLMNTPTP